jgi:reactive chlorine resistance protein C
LTTGPATRLQSVGASVLRSALVTNLVWVGALKFEDYEVENIHPLVSSSPLFSLFLKKLGEQKTARLIGVTEIAMGSLIGAKPLAPRASAIGSLGAVGMFVTTLSFLATTPGVWQEDHGAPKLSLVGQFLAKDSVLLGASLLTAADSLRAARRR